MNNETLIKVARNCVKDYCLHECPFFDASIFGCQEKLVVMLADRLEVASEDIPRNCKTCLHKENPHYARPCDTCDLLKHGEWVWRGDADGK